MRSPRFASWFRKRGFAVGITAFVIVLLSAAFSIVRFLELNRGVSESHVILHRINKVQTAFERLETTGRGYILTRDNTFLENYSDVKAALQNEVAELHATVETRPDLGVYTTRLSRAVNERVSEVDEYIERAHAEKLPDLIKKFEVRTVQRLREASYAFEKAERALLERREREAALLARIGAALILLGSAIAFFSLSVSYRFLVRTSRDLKATRETALEASRLKSDFLATMSHEIRTPMNGVMGMATLLLNTPLSDEQRSFVKTIKTSADSLLGLINRVLDHSKIEAGRLELECRDFDFQALFNSVMDLFRYWARSKSVDLRLVWDENLPRAVWGDPDRLRQVMVNLVSNALKFTEQGSVEVRVRRQSDTHIHITVKDSGRGIPHEVQSRLFQKFSQVHEKKPSSPAGSGLGLMIARELVGAMGGEIGVNSREGSGSEFWFTCELKPARTPEVPKDARTGAARKLAGHVLIVEDQLINQAVVGKFLETFGLSYSVVKDGRAAVEAVKTGKYDLVLMDCQMQGMDGYEATRAIRAWEKTAGSFIPVVAVTAEGMNADRERCFEVGMDDFISKPVDIEHLQSVLEKYLPHATVPEFERQALEHLKGYQSGDRPLVDVLVDDFLNSGAQTLELLQNAFAASEMKQAKRHAHTLKSTSRTLGLARLGRLCEEIERAQDLDSVKISELQRAYLRSCDWLTSRGEILKTGD